MVKRRRKRRFTWMPTLGGIAGLPDGTHYNTTSFGADIEAHSAALGPTDLYVTPIIPDFTQYQLAAGNDNTFPSLRDQTEGQDWALERIVGKLHVAVQQQTSAIVGITPRIIKVTAGFFVARADDENQEVPDGNNVEIDPAGVINVRQPWIWRRNWTLSNTLAASAGIDYIMEVNNANTSALDGPHIDAKSKRRIRREERLWFAIVAYGYETLGFAPTTDYSQPGIVGFTLDYRVLGQMRRSSNRSVF